MPEQCFGTLQPERFIAIESKCTEFLTPPKGTFKESYDRPDIVAALATPSWRAEYEALKHEDPTRYRHLGAAQLIKHYLGIRRQIAKPAVLLYLYWEPVDPGSDPVYATHRREVEQFGERVAGDEVEFLGVSYPELWREWGALELEWLPGHIEELQDRYGTLVGRDSASPNT